MNEIATAYTEFNKNTQIIHIDILKENCFTVLMLLFLTGRSLAEEDQV